MNNFGLRESDFKGRPGYTQVAAKVWRSGVGYVDGYKWSYSAPKVCKSRREISAQDLGVMLEPCAQRQNEKAAQDLMTRPVEVLISKNGKEYVEPHDAARVAQANGWHSPGRIEGVIASSVTGDFCESCDRLRVWCDCG